MDDVPIETNTEEKKNILNSCSKTLYVCCFDTPVGRVFSAADETYVYVLAFKECSILLKTFPKICDQLDVSFVMETKNKVLQQLENELNAYFDGALMKFTVPIKTVGTQFHQVTT